VLKWLLIVICLFPERSEPSERSRRDSAFDASPLATYSGSKIKMRRILTHPLIVSLFVIVGLIFLNNQGWLKIPQDVFFGLTASVQKISYQFSSKVNQMAGSLALISRLNQEKIRLEEENEDLLSQLVQLKEATRENEFLRQQLAISSPESPELILASVVGHSSSLLEKTLLINQGSQDGVKEGAAVITAGNFLVGRVIGVADSSAKIQLILDPNSRVNALIQESGVTGLIKSNQGLNLTVDFIPQGENVEEGQTIVTSGLAGLFPAGLLIGRISQIISIDVEIFQEARVKPAVDFVSLNKVFVIKNQ